LLLFIKEKKDKKLAFLLSLSFHKTHYVCDFCFFLSRQRRKNVFLFVIPEQRLQASTVSSMQRL